MLEFDGRATEFTKLIDALTSQIIEKITAEKLSDVGALIIKRLDYLTELVSLVVTEKDKAWLLNYLEQFQATDQTIIQTVNKERDMVKNTLLNVKKIKQYSNV